MQKQKYFFALAIIAVLAVAGCAGPAASAGGANATVTTSNATTTTLAPTTTTLPLSESLATGVSAYILENTSLYYMTNEASDAKLVKASKDGSGKTDFATGFNGASVKNLGSDSEYIYFTYEKSAGNNKFIRVSKADGKAEEVFSCSPNTLGRVFTEPDLVYLLPEAGTFCRMKKPSFASDGNFRVGVSSAGVNMVADSTAVYFPDNIWIKKAVKVKTETTVLVTDVPASNLLIDGTTVYWVSKNTGLHKIATAAGAKKTVVAAGVKAKSIAQDSSNIYVANEEIKTISSITKSGGIIGTFTKTDSTASELSVDAGHLYWIDSGSLKRKKI